jgi:hypothetical protein
MSGFTDSPDRGDADLGKRYLTVASHAVAEVFLHFYAATQSI